MVGVWPMDTSKLLAFSLPTSKENLSWRLAGPTCLSKLRRTHVHIHIGYAINSSALVGRYRPGHKKKKKFFFSRKIKELVLRSSQSFCFFSVVVAAKYKKILLGQIDRKIKESVSPSDKRHFSNKHTREIDKHTVRYCNYAKKTWLRNSQTELLEDKFKTVHTYIRCRAGPRSKWHLCFDVDRHQRSLHALWW